MPSVQEYLPNYAVSLSCDAYLILKIINNHRKYMCKNQKIQQN